MCFQSMTPPPTSVMLAISLSGVAVGPSAPLGSALHVLYVNEREAAGIFVEVCDGILVRRR